MYIHIFTWKKKIWKLKKKENEDIWSERAKGKGLDWK